MAYQVVAHTAGCTRTHLAAFAGLVVSLKPIFNQVVMFIDACIKDFFTGVDINWSETVFPSQFVLLEFDCFVKLCVYFRARIISPRPRTWFQTDATLTQIGGAVFDQLPPCLGGDPEVVPLAETKSR